MTKIEWTDATWNPTRGCSRVSEGCRHCYAERQAARNLPSSRSPTTGAAFAILNGDGPHWTGKVELIESRLTEPLHWRKPRRVFVNSMSDLFHEALPDQAIDRVFAVMALCPHITFQVLTKRAERMQEYFASNIERAVAIKTEASKVPNYNRLCEEADWMPWPYRNVWLGVSVEDQATADDRIPKLLQTPAALRFVSYEPALGPVDFQEFINPCIGMALRRNKRVRIPVPQGLTVPVLDWGIVGGESGPQARPCDLWWIESTVDQFQAASVPLFVKQVGSRSGYQRMDGWHDRTNLGAKNSKGGDWEDWPEKIRVREFPR